MDTIKAMEPEVYARYSTLTEEAIKRATSKGLEIVQLSPEAAKRYSDIIFQASWNNVSEKAPDTAAKVKSIFGF